MKLCGFEGPLLAHNGLRSLIAVSVTLCLMPAWYSQVDSTGFGLAESTDDLFVGKSLLHGDVLM